MKKISLMALVSSFGLCAALAQAPDSLISASGNSSALPPLTTPQVVDIGPNHRLWQWQSYEPAPNNQIGVHTHRYMELGSCLNYQDTNGAWLPSQEKIESFPGGAVARNGQNKVIFAGNLNSFPAADMITAGGNRMRVNVLGLMYVDRSSGSAVQIAQLQDSEGALISDNEILYKSAFEGADCDLLMINHRDGLEQNIVIHGLPDPALYSMEADQVDLECFTEFVTSDPANVTDSPFAAGSPGEDQSISWGATSLGRGKAFSLGGQDAPVPVRKEYRTVNGSHYLIERIKYKDAQKALSQLPNQSSIQRPLPGMASKNPPMFKKPTAKAASRPMKLAYGRGPERGYLVDFLTVSGAVTNYLFRGDYTFLINGQLNLAGQSNVFDPCVVIKMARGASINFVSGSGLSFGSGSFRTVYITAQDDSSLGESTGGSSPSGYYGDPALNLSALANVNLSNFRISYANRAIAASSGAFSDAQIVSCGTGISGINGPIVVENALFSNIKTNFNTSSSANTVYVLNGTFNNAFDLVDGNFGNTAFLLTNCVFVNVTNLSGNITAGYNGFFNSPVVGAPAVTSSVYPLVSVGAGSCYLTNICPFTNAGTPYVDPYDLAQLATRTVYPPIVYSSATISVPMTLSIQAARDTNGTALGWHYAPLDYAFGNSVAKSNLTFTAGTAAAWFFTSSGGTYGLAMGDSATAAFNGTVTAPCHFVNAKTVQEGGNGNWQAESWLAGLTGQSYTHNPPGMTATFSIFSSPATETGPYADNHSTLFIFRGNNCEFYSAGGGAYYGSHNVTNCLYVNAGTGLWDNYGNASETFEGCTFIRGNIIAVNPSTGPWPLTIYNCAFAGTTFNMQTSYGNTNGYYTDYNAFMLNSNLTLHLGGHEITNIIDYNWQTSWLGNYYLPPNSPLIDKGSTTADHLGMYHFTTQTNQMKETNSIVDIGYHYVAVDGFGNPDDTDGDGLPDYVEDTNGNGIFDGGDLANWLIGRFNELSTTNGLSVFTPLK